MMWRGRRTPSGTPVSPVLSISQTQHCCVDHCLSFFGIQVQDSVSCSQPTQRGRPTIDFPAHVVPSKRSGENLAKACRSGNNVSASSVKATPPSPVTAGLIHLLGKRYCDAPSAPLKWRENLGDSTMQWQLAGGDTPMWSKWRVLASQSRESSRQRLVGSCPNQCPTKGTTQSFLEFGEPPPQARFQREWRSFGKYRTADGGPARVMVVDTPLNGTQSAIMVNCNDGDSAGGGQVGGTECMSCGASDWPSLTQPHAHGVPGGPQGVASTKGGSPAPGAVAGAQSHAMQSSERRSGTQSVNIRFMQRQRNSGCLWLLSR